jgi:hypothetical protein
MDERAFWQSLSTLGGLQQSWWYNALALPSLMVAVFAILMMVIALRNAQRKIIIFLLLLFACAPLVLILPSVYAALWPRDALGMIGMAWPSAANQFPRQSAQTLGSYLGLLAQLGVAGAVIATLTSLGSLSVAAATVNVPVISTAARHITQVVRDKTQRFRRGQQTGAVGAQLSRSNCPYGMLEVLNGKHAGNQIAIRPGNTLGRKEADIVITDPITSRLHARFDVDNHRQTTIADNQSANGLFVCRMDERGVEQKHDIGALGGAPFALRSGDIIALGDPEHPEDGQHAVKLRFDHDFF